MRILVHPAFWKEVGFFNKECKGEQREDKERNSKINKNEQGER